MTEENLAQQVKEKLQLEQESRKAKIQALKDLDTKALIERIIITEAELESALRDEINFRDINAGYLSSGNSDCGEVKRILAGLANQAPGKNKEERDAWLISQRTENTDLKDAIDLQKNHAFQHATLQINIDTFRRRLDGLHGVLYLRTAQIKFLTETNN